MPQRPLPGQASGQSSGFGMTIQDPLDANQIVVDTRPKTAIIMDRNGLYVHLRELQDAKEAPRYGDSLPWFTPAVTLFVAGIRQWIEMDTNKLDAAEFVLAGDLLWGFTYIGLGVVLSFFGAIQIWRGCQNRHLRKVSAQSITDAAFESYDDESE